MLLFFVCLFTYPSWKYMKEKLEGQGSPVEFGTLSSRLFFCLSICNFFHWSFLLFHLLNDGELYMGNEQTKNHDETASKEVRLCYICIYY